MTSLFQIRTGSTLPILEVVITKDGRIGLYNAPKLEACGKPALDPNAVDLTNSSVTFQLYKAARFPALVSTSGTSSVLTDTANNISPANGVAQYQWAASDTAIPGYYYGSFQVTMPGGGVYRWPNQLESFSIEILP